MNWILWMIAAWAVALLSTGCASWLSDASPHVTGAPVMATRAPASTGPNTIAIDNSSAEGTASLINARSDAAGPDLYNGRNPAHSTYSESSKMGYRRELPSNGGLGSSSEGSLWDTAKPNGFLFTKNTRRQVGDLLLVRMEQDVNDTLNARINGIVAKKRQARQTLTQALPADPKKEIEKVVDRTVAQAAEAAADKVLGARTDGAGLGDNPLTTAGNEKFVDVDDIPVRLTEELPRGNYRVAGSKRVLILNAPYQLKLSGIVRSEDISGENLVSSARVMESKLELTK